ncbi:MAG: spermine synthase [Cytophagaceae bacterium]
MRQRNLLLIYLLFFLSGFAALCYQVVWERILTLFTGSDTISVSLIVSCFMLGLGLGNLFGGVLSSKLNERTSLLVFAGAELLISLFGFFSKCIFYDWLYESILVGDLYLRMALVFLLLLLPTFLMGLTLPILAKEARKSISSHIAILYSVNTFGAAIGAFISAWFFIPAWGFEGALRIAACMNLITSLGVFLISRQSTTNAEQQEPPGEIEKGSYSFSFWLGFYLFSGLSALSLEMIWFRILGFAGKSVSFTFPILLFFYLGGIAIGSLLGIFVIKKIKNKERFLLLSQSVILIYPLLSVLALFLFVSGPGLFVSIKEYLIQPEPEMPSVLQPFFYILLPVFLMGIPVVLMGLNFALIQKVVQKQFSEAGRRLGYLQFMNIIGSFLGSLITAFILFKYLGTSGTLIMLSLSGLLFLILFFRNSNRLKWILMLTVSILVLPAIFFFPDNHRMWAILSGKTERQVLVSEDEVAVSTIKFPDHQKDHSASVFVNNTGQSRLPYYKNTIHTVLGSLPALIHPRPTDIAIIGLGSGCTAYCAGLREETRNIICYELVEGEMDVLEKYLALTSDSGASAFLSDRRMKFRFQDGRYEIRNSSQKYDIIEADAIRPNALYSGNLYSLEYFSMIKSKLKKGGFAVTWCPTGRIKNTFMQVFPYCYQIWPGILGSNEPIEIDSLKIMERLKSPFTEKYLNNAGIDLKPVLKDYFHSAEKINASTLKQDVNTDLFPKDEYFVPYKED